MKAAPDRIMIGGRAYSWRAILALRKAQLEECGRLSRSSPPCLP